MSVKDITREKMLEFANWVHLPDESFIPYRDKNNCGHTDLEMALGYNVKLLVDQRTALKEALLKWSDGQHMNKSGAQTCMKLIDPNRPCSCGVELLDQ